MQNSVKNMTAQKEPASLEHDTLDPSAQLKYRAALDLLMHEGTLLWNRFNVFLVANSIMIAALSALISSSRHCTVFVSTLCLAGTGLSIVWLAVNIQGFRQCRGYWDIAHSTEKDHLPQQVDFLQEIASWSPKNVLIRPSCLAWGVPVIFTLVYVAAWLDALLTG